MIRRTEEEITVIGEKTEAERADMEDEAMARVKSLQELADIQARDARKWAQEEVRRFDKRAEEAQQARATALKNHTITLDELRDAEVKLGEMKAANAEMSAQIDELKHAREKHEQDLSDAQSATLSANAAVLEAEARARTVQTELRDCHNTNIVARDEIRKAEIEMARLQTEVDDLNDLNSEMEGARDQALAARDAARDERRRIESLKLKAEQTCVSLEEQIDLLEADLDDARATADQSRAEADHMHSSLLGEGGGALLLGLPNGPKKTGKISIFIYRICRENQSFLGP